MKKSLKLLLAASALCTAGFVAAAPAAMAQSVGFSFSVGDVAFGYSDGYYDRNLNWHSWRSDRERDWYRSQYRQSYYDYGRDRDRYRDRRWRDFDRGNGIGVSFNIGDVAFAYSDGYYDRNCRRWHSWRNDRERAWYRAKYSRSYYDYRRDRDRNRDRRWRDYDRDGIPNSYDRDRDNDGVPNRYDDRPNNPYRN